MKIDFKKLILLLWKLSVLFYLLRSIAEPLKYLFMISFGSLLIGYTFYFVKHFQKKAISSFLLATKELIILGAFLVAGILLSSQLEILSIKSLLNFLVITVLYFIFIDFKNSIALHKLFQGWIILTIVIGSLGILKWLNYTLELNYSIFTRFFEYGTSLVSEYNFYACFIIISLVIYFYGLHKTLIQRRLITNQLVIFLFISNIVLAKSRRGLILLTVLLAVAVVLLIVKRKDKRQIFYKNLFCSNIIIVGLLLIITMLIPFRSKLILKESTRSKITSAVFRYSTIIKPDITYSLFRYRLWPTTAIYKNDKTVWEKYKHPHQSDNLIYNGDFRYGQKFWGKFAPDSIGHEIISTEFGNAIRVSRLDGIGYWPLLYQGRNIVYYKGLTYTFDFKFRVVKGSYAPFYIGWWAQNEEPVPTCLDKRIRTINEEWFECNASYKFQKDHYGEIKTFMNTLRPFAIVDFADIKLTCIDSLNRPMYADENIDLIDVLEESRISRKQQNGNRKLLFKRTVRWKYAKEVWSTEYSWPNKIFGRGFDYLEQFGQKFYPGEDRIDYPHNPIISSFLYSGIIGGLYYIFFLVLSFWYYWKYRKHHLLFFILYLITFVFVFISSDSHFNVPIFAMLSLVPFITRFRMLETQKETSSTDRTIT